MIQLLVRRLAAQCRHLNGELFRFKNVITGV
jgi:hypothetical protein